MDVEVWNSVFKTAAMWLGIFTALAAGAGWWTESIVNDRQAQRLTSIAKDVSEAKTRQTEAETRLATVEIEAAKQRERAAVAELELFKLKERQDDRRFTDEQFMRLINALSGGNDRPGVQMMFIDEGEPKRFAELLLTVFESARWKAEIVKWNRAGMLTTGVNIDSLKGDVAANEAARFVAQQLSNVGTPAMTGEVMDDPTFPANTVIIRVGPKPR